VAKVYIVMLGDYSDRHGVGAYTSLKTAKAKCKLYNRRNENSDFANYTIDEYELDPDTEQVNAGVLSYSVTFLSNGDIWDTYINDKPSDRNECYEVVHPGYAHLVVYVWAKDDDHAKKIAQDKRAEYLARLVDEEESR